MLKTLLMLLVLVAAVIGALYLYSGKIKQIPTQIESTTVTSLFPSGYEIAAWEWDSLSNPATLSRLTSLRAQGVTTIYLSLGDYIDLIESKDEAKTTEKITSLQNQISEYIKQAQNQGMTVQALAGGPEWIVDSHQYLNDLTLDAVLTFNAVHPDTPFSGVHFDIEPPELEDYAQNKQQLWQSYVMVVDGMVSRVEQLLRQGQLPSDFKLGYAVPHWIDNAGDRVDKVTFDNEEKYPFYFIANRLNRLKNGYLAVMAYRSFAESSNGSIELISDEVGALDENYPNLYILLGVETNEIDEVNSSFYGKSKRNLSQQVAKALNHYGSASSLEGVAINDAKGLINLSD